MMRRFVAALLASAVCVSPALGQVPSGFPPGVFTGRGALDASGSAPTYTGPLDAVSGETPVGYWALRAASAANATAGVAAVNICTAADALCTDVHVTATGGLNASDISSSLCGSINTCTCKTIYDQVGANNMTQSTIASRPLFFPNGVSAGLPACNNTSAFTTLYMVASMANLASGPYSFVGVFEATATPSGNLRVLATTTAPGLLYGSGDNFELFGGGGLVVSSVTSSHSTFYAVIARTDASNNGVIAVNNTIVTGNAGNVSTGTQIAAFADTGGSSNFAGYGSEFGLFSSNLTTAHTTALTSNMRAYWGI